MTANLTAENLNRLATYWANFILIKKNPKEFTNHIKRLCKRIHKGNDESAKEQLSYIYSRLSPRKQAEVRQIAHSVVNPTDTSFRIKTQRYQR